MINNKIKISVGDFVQFAFKSGDIKSVFLSNNRAVDGIKAHQKIQKRFKNEYINFESEITIKHEFTIENTNIELNGRIDGIFKDNIPTITEIKSVAIDLAEITEDYSLLHWAQCKVYALMYALQNDLNQIIVQLTYVELNNYETKQFNKQYEVSELREFVGKALESYLVFAKLQLEYNCLKEQSIKQLVFPFGSYRKGQKKLVSSVYKVILMQEKLFVRAPTGIGKTMATIFPAVKSLAKQNGKIFYLTAKTIGRDVAEKAFYLLEQHGLVMRRIVITAKDKVCLNCERKCDAEYCKYAKGHFDRVNEALLALLKYTNHYNRDVIQQYAELFTVCPYELTLDLSLYCDCIICDYNYAFDPSAVLKRYFVEGNGWFYDGDNNYIFLIDEAHNLVDRARSMYSSSISKKAILEQKKKLKDKDKFLYKYLNKMNKLLIEQRKVCETTSTIVEQNYNEEFVDLVRGVIHRTEKIFAQLVDWQHLDALLEFYFDCYDFLKKIELYDERYVTIYEKIQDELIMRLFCLDPSNNLKNYLNNASSAVLFSATLTPINYFVKILGGDENSYGLSLAAPFNASNLCLVVNQGISTKYQDREHTYQQVVNTIHSAVNNKKGNYLVFFPSYKYMLDVYELYIQQVNESIEVMVQERYLNEYEKEEFINAFNENLEHSLVAFVVLGGMFSEGIDLKGEKLSGAIIVGVGLPSLCLERNLIKQHFDKEYGTGFQYSYMYPGMNKVLQAAGRVIRTSTDTGIVILIDTRFAHNYYQKLFPPEWKYARYVTDGSNIKKLVTDFWNSSIKV
ncbi:ATP-dependent DNA helicase [Clostridium sp. 'deep sea']|uniref:ATP-dependent DNA helicase n=1 Tax=Clostridium sp. 'deep sea' TaxID=2779445 RepID=UPI0018964436|nr:ATP-dependent DNA helicase [Clostridium sp. 'deep sea']QOR34943.1 ATP-dependent DNA helicase [Clostridium sp. 'deep sea']